MEITPKMIKAIGLLYEGKTKQEIANDLKISVSTLNRWTNNDDFKAALVAVASQQFGQLVPEATATIREIMGDTAAKPGDRLNAARTVLEYAKVLDRSAMDANVTLRVVYDE